MSLALRFGSLAAPASSTGSVISIALPILPLLPRLSNLFPQSTSTQISLDPRLEELKRKLQEGGQPPFMIDNGTILKAVPKKRPSHRRTREKLYSPGDKQIQPLENLGRCPACGHVKRSHFMCMHCFAEIKAFLKAKKKAILGEPEVPQSNLDPVDEKIIYPGKYVREYEQRLKKKDWVPKREEPLMFDPSQVKKQ
ncbi:putative 54S ribosomal protein [Clavispora lusitaniae]|uniref:Large ribosomal subunit protein bL32m n=2 Tax=Clavispora lusitaniae TaxID=36911 RepID=C4Y3Y4_CLAL4|nr:uncharacterized protein CLUG_02356 [Clavispora lusitaniae ATCC 42720]KAF5211509.1 hypothetical protein E0198_002824 [Clavispora lusitaniae]EEQ38230.1 hypothetical protein CLUG_02356 [Clavispora lusitaniae ATCC 42720]KAF7580366.1 Ribosomal L32p family protein [Clavispora lusitaniae]QFZ27933.1 putative 54S ribosomal protein [Clavispora lusitaniae]QFZ32760.1 putative 54S ribosomal protein [Clavispora lusitaniae]